MEIEPATSNASTLLEVLDVAAILGTTCSETKEIVPVTRYACIFYCHAALRFT